MRQIIVFVFLVSCVFRSLGVVVRGRVEETDNGGRVPNVKVTFTIDGKSSSCTTDDNGNFEISVNYGKYIVSASHEGYVGNEVPVELQPGGINHLVIRLAPDFHELGEVVVTGRRYLTKFTEGSLVYDLSKDERAQGKNLFSALNLVPLLSASPTGELEVRGSGAYQVYLNGRPYSLAEGNAFSVLSSLKAENVKSVEVVTDPALRYGLPDETPIINIIMCKELFDGLYNTFSLSGNTQPKAHGQEMFLASIKKVRFSLTYDYDFNGQYDQKTSDKTEYLRGQEKGAVSLSESKKGNEGNFQFHTGRGIFEWSINPLSTLYADVHARIERTDFKILQAQQWTSPEGETTTWETETGNHNTAGYVEANINFRRFFKSSPSATNYMVGYRFSHNPDRRSIATSIKMPGSPETLTKSHTRGGLNQHSLRYYQMVIPADRQYIAWSADIHLREGDTSSTDEYDTGMHYHQDIYSAYLWYSGTIAKGINLSARVTGEYSRFTMDSPGIARKFTRDRFSVRPNLTLSYYASARNYYTLQAYSSTRRPSVIMLNPFVAYYNPLSSMQGNPELKDERDHHLKLTGSYMSQRFSLTLGLNGYVKKDYISAYYYISENQSSVVMSYTNLTTCKSLGGNYFLQFRPTQLLNVDVSGVFGHAWMRDRGMQLSQNSWEYHLNARLNLFLPHNWSLTAKYGRHKGLPEAFCENNAFNMYSVAAQKSFLKGALTVGLTVDNFLGKYNHSRRTIMTPSIVSTIRRDILIQAVGLNVMYTFHKGKEIKLERSNYLKTTDIDSGVM